MLIIIVVFLFNKKTIKTLPGNVIFEVEVLDENSNKIIPPAEKTIIENSYTLDWKYYLPLKLNNLS